MKKQALRKAPLIHSVIQLRFTTTPEVKEMSVENMSLLHQKMIEEGFPEKITSTFERLDININSDSQTQTTTRMVRNLFRSEGESETIELSSDENITFFTLKSSSYENFFKFNEKFYSLLTVCLEVFPGFKKTLLKNVELRYVDLIVPCKGKTLPNFVDRSVIPMSLSTLDKGHHLHGFSQRYVSTADDCQFKVAFEEIPKDVNNRFTKILPDDLGEKDPKCGLIIPVQESWNNISSPTYGILDIQHVKEFRGSPKIELKTVKDAIQMLHEKTSSVFWEVITEEAKIEWGVYDVK